MGSPSLIENKVGSDTRIGSSKSKKQERLPILALQHHPSVTKWLTYSHTYRPSPVKGGLSNQGQQKLQNCVKAAIALVCPTCKRQLLFALLQWITFVCTSAIENILCTTIIVNFCMN